MDYMVHYIIVVKLHILTLNVWKSKFPNIVSIHSSNNVDSSKMVMTLHLEPMCPCESRAHLRIPGGILDLSHHLFAPTTRSIVIIILTHTFLTLTAPGFHVLVASQNEFGVVRFDVLRVLETECITQQMHKFACPSTANNSNSFWRNLLELLHDGTIILTLDSAWCIHGSQFLNFLDHRKNLLERRHENEV